MGYSWVNNLFTNKQSIGNDLTVGFLNGICSFSLKFQTFSLLFPGYFFDRTIIYGYNYITDFDTGLLRDSSFI